MVPRRDLLESLGLSAGVLVSARLLWRLWSGEAPPPPLRELRAPGAEPVAPPDPGAPEAPFDPPADEGIGTRLETAAHPHTPDPHWLEKIELFDQPYAGDLQLSEERFPLLRSTTERLRRAQRVVGHGNFNLLGFDELLRSSRDHSQIGPFERAELDFLEELFFAEASRYGFLGDKVVHELTAVVPPRDAEKVPGTGHYLFRGDPLRTYRRIRKDLGETVVLTSGIRGVVKQTHLFLEKALRTGGNLSQASRSLAPPGYSYHAAGDFDLGKVGLGLDNFSKAFAETDEFRRLVDLGYIDLRYTRTNPFGVRFEPWHIKMV